MDIRISKDWRHDPETEIGMIIPCSGYALAIKKVDKTETGKCPICGADIYVEPTGICGHM